MRGHQLHEQAVLRSFLVILCLTSILFIFFSLLEHELHDLDFRLNSDLSLFFDSTELSLELCHGHFLVHLTKGVHDCCQDQIHQEKGAEYYYQEEVDWG